VRIFPSSMPVSIFGLRNGCRQVVPGGRKGGTRTEGVGSSDHALDEYLVLVQCD
jgi:hypothetical protein